VRRFCGCSNAAGRIPVRAAAAADAAAAPRTSEKERAMLLTLCGVHFSGKQPLIRFRDAPRAQSTAAIN